MNNCWKCGRELPEGQVECDPPCFGNPQEEDHDYEQAVKDYEAKTIPIDWDKVRTLEDMKLVIKTLVCEDRVFRGSEEFQILRRFLKESNCND